MKKYLIFILSFFLLINITGCGISSNKPDRNPGNPSNSSQSTDGDSDDSNTGIVAPQAQMISVSVPIVTVPAKADDGTVIFKYTYQNISMTHPDPHVTDKVITDFLNRIDQTRIDADSIHLQAKTDYRSSVNWNPYLCMISFDPTRIDQGVLSFFGSNVSYIGSIRPDTNYIAINYDLISGDPLDFTDILKSEDCSSDLFRLVVSSLKAIKGEKNLRNDFEDIVNDYFSKKLNAINNWYFTETGLTFYFPPYEIAPYASGIISAEIPYNQLAGIIDDAYFPNERDVLSGNMAAKSFDNTTDSKQYDQFAELVIDKDSYNTLLYTDGFIGNIRIETGHWSADGASYTPLHTIFATSSLSSNKAILLEADIQSSLPELRLSYQTGDDVVYYYIILDNNVAKLIPC